MSYSAVEELPNEVTEKLPQGAQQVFMAAFNAASSNGMSEEAAMKVAWNSITNSYEQGSDGKWHPKPEEKKDSTGHQTGTMKGG
jgi:cation transport regulator